MSTDLIALDEQLAKEAQALAAENSSQTYGERLSMKGGVLRYADTPLPGNQALCIILASTWERAYYTRKYSPDDPSPPTCYAIGDKETLAPHKSMAAWPDIFEPQSETCATCQWAKFGSAVNDAGKPKTACQMRRRLALLPAGLYTQRKGSRDFDADIFTDKQHFQTADTVMLRLPVTSSGPKGPFSQYITKLAASVQRPLYAVFTRLYVEPHERFQYVVGFDMLEAVPNDLISTLRARIGAATESLMGGYSGSSEE